MQGEQTNGWGWVERAVQTGLPAAWMTEQDGHPCEDLFMAKASCGIVGTPDQVFRLNGISTPLPAAAVTKKKCKKGFKLKKVKTKSGKFKKKCVRKKKKKKK